MAFCSNCGQKLAEGERFCINCNETRSDDNSTTQRKVVYESNVHKCPNCGEIIGSFFSRCPACGFEFRDTRLNTSLKEFIQEIDACDKTISVKVGLIQTGWSSWNSSKRFWWVILNVFTCCFPIIFTCMILPLFMYGKTPKLIPEEQRKVTLIENFPFPNDRESIAEALLFIKSKVSYLTVEKINKRTMYWSEIWLTKAKQLYKKSEIVSKGDCISNDAYLGILSSVNKIKNKVRIRAIFGIIIVFAMLIYTGVYNFLNPIDRNTIVVWQEDGLFAEIPKPQTDKGLIIHESDTVLELELYQVAHADFEQYVQKCRDAGFEFDIEKRTDSFKAQNKEGYAIELLYQESEDLMEIEVNSYWVEK